VLLVDDDRAVELPVHGVATQQGGALDDVLAALAAAAHDDRTQAQTGAAGAVDEDAGQEAADPAEAVEDDVARAGVRGRGGAHDLGELLRQDRGDVAAGPDGRREAAQVDRAGTQVQLHQLLRDRERLVQVQLDAVEVARVAVRLDDPGDGLVEKTAPVHGQQDGLLAVQAAHEGDQPLRCALLGGPRLGGGLDLVGQETNPFTPRWCPAHSTHGRPRGAEPAGAGGDQSPSRCWKRLKPTIVSAMSPAAATNVIAVSAVVSPCGGAVSRGSAPESAAVTTCWNIEWSSAVPIHAATMRMMRATMLSESMIAM